jgi:hypothetical protein
MAMPALTDSIVSVTTRHSESAPIASDAATALINREEATGVGSVSKPNPTRGDRIMVWFLEEMRRESAPDKGNFTKVAGNFTAAGHQLRQNHGEGIDFPAIRPA